MGLLNRAIAAHTTSAEDIRFLIADFHHKNPLFHCIVLQRAARLIADMMAGHGAVCADLPGTQCLVLLPGGLDRELFTHRLSQSTGSAALLQTSFNSSSLAINTLSPYLR